MEKVDTCSYKGPKHGFRLIQKFIFRITSLILGIKMYSRLVDFYCLQNRCTEPFGL